MTKLWFIEKVPAHLQDAFTKRMYEIKDRLGIEPNWLMVVMLYESGVNPAAVNPVGGATGLIQFMPTTARGLGTSTEALRMMDHVQQLDYVEKYYRPYAGKIKSGEDLYLINFYPYAIYQPDSYIIGSEKGMGYAKKVYEQNAGVRRDTNKDGYISKGEWKKSLREKIEKKLQDPAKINFFFQEG